MVFNGQTITFCLEVSITMKQLKEKFKRKVKYWRVSYMQTSGRDRLNLYMFALMMLAYAWWVLLSF